MKPKIPNSLSLTQLTLIDRICDQYDVAWRHGANPRLEDYLEQGDASQRSELFGHLLEIEIDYRRQNGERPEIAEFIEKFPAFGEIVTQVFKQLSVDQNANAVVPTVDLPVGESEGTVLGRYKLLQPLGEGGFGSVYLAEQEKPVRRRVALKIIKLGMDTKQVIARFEAERQALALMEHPHIAKVLDAGATHTGRPYFVMELVKGVPMTKYCDDNNMPLRDRLELFTAVCGAVQHAHQKGIIHRDIKPSNILITEIENKPVPKVIDFGIAKATDQRLTERTLYTELGQFIGTPAYMSPEQTDVQALDIDTRSDIYSLGVVLYELLTGSTPFDMKPQGGHLAGLEEIKRIIREEEPRKPSTRLSTLGEAITTVAKRRGMEPTRLNSVLRGDLDWIVMKALEKDRSRRYETASALADDVQRFLVDEAVQARPPSRRYRIAKYMRRHRGALMATGLITTATIVGLVATITFAIREAHERKLAAQRESQANKVAQFQAEQLSQVEVDKMGYDLRQGLLDEFRLVRERTGVVSEELDHQLDDFQVALAGVNFADLATNALKFNIYEPTLAAIEKEFAASPLIQARLLQSLATTMRLQGLLNDATEPQQRAVAIRRTRLGEDHPDTIESTSSWGELLAMQNEFEIAEETLRKSVEDLRHLRGNDDVATVRAISSLGALLVEQGKLQEAEPYIREAVETARRALGNTHPVTAQALAQAGNLVAEQGNHNQAELYLREAIEISRNALSDSHRDTLNWISNLAAILMYEGKLQEAETHLRQCVEELSNSLGRDHPDTLQSITYLGEVLLLQGKPDEAEPIFRESLAAFGLMFGQDHRSTRRALNNLGGVLLEQGRLDEAESHLRRSLEIARRTLGDDHLDTISSIDMVGRLLLDRGDYVEAEAFFREALNAARNTLGEDHPNTLTEMNSLSMTLLRLGRLDEAESLSRAHLQASVRLRGSDHRGTLASMHNLAQLLQSRGNFVEAEQKLRKVLEALDRDYGTNHPDTLMCRGSLLVSLREQGKLQQAAQVANELVKSARSTIGPEHPFTMQFMQMQASVLRSQGRVGEAAELLAEVLMIQTTNDHPKIADTLSAYAQALLEQGDYEKAQEVIEKWIELLEQAEAVDFKKLSQARIALAGTLVGQEKFTEANAIFADATSGPELSEIWRLWAKSIGGAVLASQKRWDEAEPLLIESFNEMQHKLPALRRVNRWIVSRACERVIALYEAWGKPDEAAKWQAELDRVNAEIERLRSTGPPKESEANPDVPID